MGSEQPKTVFVPLLSAAMIKLTRLNNSTIYLNPDLIKSIEETPDTIISLVNDDHFLVREKTEEIIDQIVSYRVRIIHQSRQFASTDTPA
jgi:flagellar protein FlbD